MNISYMIYQAERTPSRAEQHTIDADRGELAQAVAGLLRRGRGQRGGRGRHATMPSPCPAALVPDYPPAEWTGAARC
jgi:hypothetical protein